MAAAATVFWSIHTHRSSAVCFKWAEGPLGFAEDSISMTQLYLRIGRLVASGASISPHVELGILLFPDSKVVVQDVISSILLC